LVYRRPMDPETSALLVEAGHPNTSEPRLAELAAGPHRDVAVVALGRLVRLRTADGIAPLLSSAVEPSTQVTAALGLVMEALRLLPGVVASFSHAELSTMLADAGWDHVDTLVLVMIDGLLANRGPQYEEMARSIAASWSGTFGELLEAVTILHQPYEKST
jgi:hypothetical protein